MVVEASTMASMAASLLQPHSSHRSTSLVNYAAVRRRAPPQISSALKLPAAGERVASAAVYVLPFLNSLHYGHHLFTIYPPLAKTIAPILPLYSAYRSIPLAPFIAFFSIYLCVVRNPSLPHCVRFNSMQALILDVSLSAPLLLARVLPLGRGALWSRLTLLGHSATFISMAVFFVYCFTSCLFDSTPALPFVADAANRQL